MSGTHDDTDIQERRLVNEMDAEQEEAVAEDVAEADDLAKIKHILMSKASTTIPVGGDGWYAAGDAANGRNSNISSIDEGDGAKGNRCAEDADATSLCTRDFLVDDGHGGHDAHDNHDGSNNGGTGNGCGRGIIKDIRKTVGTWWIAEMTNFNQKTIAVSFFIFFAAVAPAITFGAVYAKVTNDQIGAVEMLTATAWCGIMYALVGGQPIMINGGTGPVLAFSTVLYNIAESIGVNFLVLNAWTGLWVTFFMLVAAFVDLNRLMKHATRFTDEIFAMLIASIFIIDSLGSPFSDVGIYWYFTRDHKSHDSYEDQEDYSYIATAFFSMVLCIGTTWLAFTLRGIKFSAFFPNDAWRTVVSDFAVVAAILTSTLIANELFDNVEVERLNVPSSFQPTQICCDSTCMTSFPQDCIDVENPHGARDWFVDLSDLNGHTWVPIFAAIPAFLAFILVFLDNGITWHLLNHPSHKLSHGDAYNWDTVVVGLMIGVNSLIGLPWLVAATVRSLTHLNGLAETNEAGKIMSVQETRLTNLFIHVLVLASLFALDVLKLIPVPVLYGVFLYMGLASLGTNQFWCRFLMLFQQPQRFKKEPFTEYMDTKRMHLYTLLQLACFLVLLVFRSISSIAIAFPIIIKLCIPIRMYVLSRIFTEEELIYIDTDDDIVGRYLQYKADKEERRMARDVECDKSTSDANDVGANDGADDDVTNHAELPEDDEKEETA